MKTAFARCAASSSAYLAKSAWRALVAGLLLGGSLMSAQATERYTRSALLVMPIPIYCADSELSDEYARFGPRWQYWAARMGPKFNSIHHYCQGMIDMLEARKHPPRSQGQVMMLKRAVAEYNYLLQLSPSELRDFPLWPEMLMKRGEAAVMLEDWGLAYSSYADARQVKPDYWQAYHGWAEVLVRLGKKDEARALLKQGLAYSPKVPSMRQLFVKLGGSPSEIPDTPLPVKPSDAASAPAAADPAASDPSAAGQAAPAASAPNS